MNPGQVYSLSHFDMDLSIAFIQDGMKFSSMFLFHATIRCQISQKQSKRAGGDSWCSELMTRSLQSEYMTCTCPTRMEPLHRCSRTLMTKMNDDQTHQQSKSIPTNLSNATIHHMSLVVDPRLYWF